MSLLFTEREREERFMAEMMLLKEYYNNFSVMELHRELFKYLALSMLTKDHEVRIAFLLSLLEELGEIQRLEEGK